MAFLWNIRLPPLAVLKLVALGERVGGDGTIAASEDDRKYVAAIEKLIGKAIPLVDGAAAADAKPKSASKSEPKAEAKTREKPARKEGSSRGRGKSRRSNETHPGELPAPPDCKGDTLQATGHVPAFLLR